MNSKIYNFSQAINFSLNDSMKKFKNLLIIGQGVDDPKFIFGTTKGLIEKFGKERVVDMPTAENSMVGISIGLSTKLIKSVLVFQRAEFALLAAEQIINQAAKWYFLSAGKSSVSIVFRILIGRGWGQGPQHSQSLEMVYANIPGLKIISPSCPNDAYHLLMESIKDNNPVIFLEHRWLYDIKGPIKKGKSIVKIGKCKKITNGKDITLVSYSYNLIECQRTIKILNKMNVKVELIDMHTIRPIDYRTITNSVNKTRKLLFVDNGWSTYGVGAEIIAKVSENLSGKKIITSRLGILDSPIPSSINLAKHFYPTPFKISKKILKMLNKDYSKLKSFFDKTLAHDQPNENFKGPF
tara:strand:- start:87 stop:1145 length:1059 start_codon:yes stop_codon:yes gene_type:complete